MATSHQKPSALGEWLKRRKAQLKEAIAGLKKGKQRPALVSEQSEPTEKRFAAIRQRPAPVLDRLRPVGNWLLRAGVKLRRTLLPTRRDNLKQIAVKLLFTISLVTLIGSSIYFVGYFFTGVAQRNIIEDGRDIWHRPGLQTADKFELLQAQNSDIRGWISISNTSIDNPVCQAEDDVYYLDHNQVHESSRYGAVYLSCHDVIDAALSDKNLVIYGHNMLDGSMFGTLKRLRNLAFYKENPNVLFETPFFKGTYKIFAVFLLNADPLDDNGSVYNVARDTFASEADFNAWINQAYSRSIIQTGITAEYGDNLLTLMTCANDFNDARLVVMARKTRPGESEETDTSEAVVNATPRYPKRWYDDKGLAYPY